MQRKNSDSGKVINLYKRYHENRFYFGAINFQDNEKNGGLILELKKKIKNIYQRI